MKKLTLSLLASFSFLAPLSFPASASAMPIWAEAVASSHCEYLAMGATWDQALAQALRDKSNWLSEIAAAGDLGSKAIGYAIQLRCATINNRAFRAYEARNKKSGAI